MDCTIESANCGRSERMNLPVQCTDNIRLGSYEVHEAVVGGRIDETIANPLGGAYAGKNQRDTTATDVTYPSFTSATTSKASSTPSSVRTPPPSMKSVYA